MKALVYPLGYPVEIEGPAVACLEAVRRWPEEQGLFDEEPLRFEAHAAGGGGCEAARFLPAARGFRLECGRSCATFDTVTRRGTVWASAEAMEALLEVLVLTALDWTFFIPVQAACVARNGRSVLLCGEAHAGKSTLAFVCAQAGWTFVSDNTLHWADAPSNLLVTGAEYLRLREGARMLFRVGQSKIVPRKRSRTAAPGPLVFLRRREGAARLIESSRQDARTYLAKYDLRPDRDYAERRYEELLRLGVYRLEYENATEAVPLLEPLA